MDELKIENIMYFALRRVMSVSTRIWRISPSSPIEQISAQLEEAAQLLASGEVVAFPTETVYGLGGNALSDSAIVKIFEAKGRPSDNPLIVHVAGIEQIRDLVEDIPSEAENLMRHFWPGPLTLLLKKKPGVMSDKATSGLPLVGIRIPDHPVALQLLRAANVPVAAPSANASGKPSPTQSKHVEEDLKDKIAGIVDGGATGIGVESTVVDCVSEPDTIIICRPGGVTKSDLERVASLGKKVVIDPAVKVKVEDEAKSFISDFKPKAPGMKYRHYSPRAPLILINGDSKFIRQVIAEKKNAGVVDIGVMVSTEVYECECEFLNSECLKVVSVGSEHDLPAIARKLYDALREFDETSVQVIFCQSFSTGGCEGLEQAIMNRLLKAAAEVVRQ